MSIFEVTMLICFGASWPLAVYRTYIAKSCAGKSLGFLVLILIGYVAGCCHKVWFHCDWVVLLYILNGAFVLADLTLTIYYRNARVRPSPL